MRHASLFSGIGGFDLAAQWMGWENVFQVEIDGFCQKVLEKNFPNVKRYGDIKQFNGTEWAGKIDILTGGFPCQPFSSAGQRKGTEDDRHLWPQMLRIIAEVQPRWIVGENVSGLLNWSGGLVLKQIKTDLEDKGFTMLPPSVLPACAVNAPHRRDRIWIIAHSEKGPRNNENTGFIRSYSIPEERFNGNTRPESSVPGVDDGIPGGLYENRVGSIGNAIVPQVAFEIFKAIEQVNL